MIGRTRWLACFAAMVATPVATGLAEERPLGLELAIAFYAGGVHALNLDVAAKFDQSTYRIEARAQTRGMLNWLVPWRSESISKGQIAGGRIQPLSHEQNGQFLWRERRVVLRYGADGDIAATVRPEPDQEDRKPIRSEMLRGSIDALSAALIGVAKSAPDDVCNTTLPIFDGRRRYDLKFLSLARETLAASQYSTYVGEALKCRVDIVPIAGFQRNWLEEKEAEPEKADTFIWLAPFRSGRLTLPVRLESTSSWGPLVAHVDRLNWTDEVPPR